MPNVLHKPVSYYTNIKDVTSQQTVILHDFLKQPDPRAEVQLKKVRTSTDKDAMDKAKESLPYITPAGTFSHRNDTSIIIYSGLLQIDMDLKHNLHHPDWEALPIILKDDPHVAYIGLSASGRSYWGLIPISHPERHREHWEAISQDFSTKYSIILDDCTSVISQPRYYAYDPQAYVNTEATTYTQLLSPPPAHKAPPIPAHAPRLLDDRAKFDRYVRAICEAKVDITGNRKQWVTIGMAIKTELGDEGLDPYINICQFAPSFDEAECRKTYHSMKPGSGGRYGPVKLGTFFMHCHDHGIRPEEYQPRVRIHRPIRKPPIEAGPTDSPPPATWAFTQPRIAPWLYKTDNYSTSPKVKVEAVTPAEDTVPIVVSDPVKASGPVAAPEVNNNARLHGVEACHTVTSSRPDDERPHVPFTMSGMKKITALLSADHRLFIDTPPSYHTFTVYSSIEAYNTRSERPTFIAKDEVDGQGFTVVLIELDSLIIQPPASHRANFTL